MNEKIQNILKEFGEFEEIQIKSDKVAYVLNCKTKKVIDNPLFKAIDTISLLISMGKNNSAFVFCFNIGAKKDFNNDIMDVINKTNEDITYGKFIVDDDDDVIWSHVFDVENLSINDFKNYVYSCCVGIGMLFENGLNHDGE